jgi:hypothetical protein
VQIVAGQHLMLIQPAADGLALEAVMQETCIGSVLVALADEAAFSAGIP